MKKVFFIIFFLITNILYGHMEPTHRHIATEAWKLCINTYPGMSSIDMNNWIGTSDETTYMLNFVGGIHNEDVQDIIYMNCGFRLNFFSIALVPCTRTTVNHLWDADAGDTSTNSFWGAGSGHPNALVKAKHYWYGTHSYIQGNGYVFYAGRFGVIADKLDHNGLVDMYNTGNVRLIGFWNTLGQYIKG